MYGSVRCVNIVLMSHRRLSPRSGVNSGEGGGGKVKASSEQGIGSGGSIRVSLAVTGKMKQSIGVCIVYSKLHAYVVGTMVKHFPGPHDQDHDTRIEKKMTKHAHTV